MKCFINYKNIIICINLNFQTLRFAHFLNKRGCLLRLWNNGQNFFQRVYICDRQTLSIPIFHCILMFSLQYIQAVLLPHFYWISGRHNYTATLLTFYHIKARSQRYYGFTFSAYPFMWFYCLFCFYVLQVVVAKYVSHILRTYTFFF